MGVPFPNPSLQQITRADDEITFVHHKSVDGSTYRMHLKAIKRNGFAYLLAGWSDARFEKQAQFVDDAFSKVVIHGPAQISLQSDLTGFNLEPTQLLPAVRKGQSILFNELALSFYATRQWQQALELFKVAARYAPTNPVLVNNALMCFRHLDKQKDALTFLTESRTDWSERNEIQLTRATLLAETGQIESALELYKKIFDNGFVDDDAFAQYVLLLSNNGEREQAIEIIEKYLLKRESLALRIRQAQLLSAAERAGEAVDLLKAARRKSLFNGELELALVEALMAHENYAEASKNMDELLRRGVDGPYSRQLKGQALLGLKLYREARDSFERASKLDPKDKAIQSYLDYVNAVLGQGQNYSIKEKIEPVSIPASVRLEGEAANTLAEAREFGAFYQYQLIATDFRKGKHRITTYKMKAQVLDQAGMSQFSALQFALNPVTESMYVNELIVRDATGKIAAQGDPDNYYLIDASESMASYDKLLNVPVPALSPGATIEATVTTRDLVRPETFRFMTVTPSKSLPLAKFTLVVTGDITDVTSHLPPGQSFSKIESALVAQVENPPVIRWEPFQPELSTFIPSIYLGPKSSSWKEIVAKYLNDIREKLAPSEAVEKFASEKMRGLSGEEEKLNALCSAVQKNVRYKAIEFGTRGTIPESPAQTLNQGYGDCKDSAVLLQALLRTAGTESKLALVKPQSTILQDLPSLDQFTHMILYLPKSGTFLDPSDKSGHLPTLPPANLLGSVALILDEKEPKFVSIPEPKGAMNKIVVNRHTHIDAQNNVQVTETATLFGYTASTFRALMENSNQEDRLALMERLTARFSAQLDLLEWNCDGFEDHASPLKMTTKYTYKRPPAESGTISFQIPHLWERFTFFAEKKLNRRNPVSVSLPSEIHTTTTVEYPRAWSPKLTAMEGSFSKPYASARLNIAKGENQLRYESSALFPSGRYSAGEYTAFQKALEEVVHMLEPEVRFEKTTAL